MRGVLWVVFCWYWPSYPYSWALGAGSPTPVTIVTVCRCLTPISPGHSPPVISAKHQIAKLCSVHYVHRQYSLLSVFCYGIDCTMLVRTAGDGIVDIFVLHLLCWHYESAIFRVCLELVGATIGIVLMNIAPPPRFSDLCALFFSLLYMFICRLPCV